MPPKSIGRYRIVENLGSGGMAVVYLAVDTAFDRQVAVKILPSNLCTEEDNRERFRREARSIAGLEHAAVVPVYDYGEESGQPYLVMRYMPGGSLKDRLSRSRLPLAPIGAILTRISAALDKAHAKGMIHRDIKPANILFDLEENAYIADFGLVKLLEASSQLTQSEFFGTPAYTSPEQARGEKTIDGRADVYSLAATLFHMLAGSPPYSAGNPMALMMKHVADPIPRLTDFAGGLPDTLQAVIDRGMAKAPEARYPTAGEMARAFGRILADHQPAAPALWETEHGSVPPVSFDVLRKIKPKAEPPKPEPDDAPTRKDAPARARQPDPEAAPPSTVAPIARPAPRRRLDWKPLADAPPPVIAADVPTPAPASGAKTPSAAQSVYAAPRKPPEKNKLAGVPALILILILVAIGVLYVLWQRGMISF
jgi:serine/threonine-protein kinase